MTHEVERSDGEIDDLWEGLGPAEAIPSERLSDIPVGSDVPPAPDYDLLEPAQAV